LLTHRQTNRQADKQTNKVWQKHYLLGGGNQIVYNIILIELVNPRNVSYLGLFLY